MAGFAALPNEIMDEVIVDLDFRDFFHLSLTCKPLREYSLPHLYRSITLDWTAQHSFNSMALLLRSLEENAELASLVKELHFVTPDIFIRGLEDVFELRDRSGDLDEVIAKLIRHCYEIKVLSIDKEILHDSAGLQTALAKEIRAGYANNKWFLRKLERIELATNWDLWPRLGKLKLDMDLFLFCFHFRSLRELTMCLPHRTFTSDEIKGTVVTSPWEEMSRRDLPKPPVADHLTTLRLRKTQIQPKILGELLLHTPSLTILDYDYAADGTLPLKRTMIPLSGSELRTALLLVKQSLRHLTVYIRPFYHVYDEWRPEIDWVKDSLGPLLDFCSLRTLSITLDLLLGPRTLGWKYWKPLHEYIPPRVEVLSLSEDLDEFWARYEWGWNQQDFITPFIQDYAKQRSPNLRALNFAFCEDWDCWGQASKDKLKGVCISQGLCCEVMQWLQDEFIERIISEVEDREKKRAERLTSGAHSELVSIQKESE